MRLESAWWYWFAAVFTATAIAETFVPDRVLASSTARRWTSNGILLAISTATVICAYQLSGITLALAVQADTHGLLNHVSLPWWLSFGIGFAIADLTAYASHRFLHAAALLWRLHRVHHSETDLDLTTGLRFHPAEALYSQGILLVVIAAMGLPAGAVAVASLVTIAQNFFEHANLRIGPRTDRALRLVIITPGMHRVHHAQGIAEQNSNFGTIFSLWDRLFGTYRFPASGAGPSMLCGLAEIVDGSSLGGVSLLALPFRGMPGQAQTEESPAQE